MQLIVLASEAQKAELGERPQTGLVWIEKQTDFLHYPAATAYLDLQYEQTPERNSLLQQLLPKPVLVNSVAQTLSQIGLPFSRINGWNTFLASPVIEAATASTEQAGAAEVLAFLGKTVEWLPDEPGFITARVVSMVINEAYLALDEGVSTKEEINTAMKLGTAYPYGPFEWGEKIGLRNVATLLKSLSQKEQRYTPAPLLLQEAFT